MDWRSKLGKAIMWGTGGLAVAVLAMTGFTLIAGDDEGDSEEPRRPGTSQPSAGGGDDAEGGEQGPTYAPPEEWSEPQRWAVLPRGKQVDGHDNEIGFPHTEEGGVAMLVAAQSITAEGERTLVDEQMSTYASYLVEADRSETNEAKVRAAAKEADAELRRGLGVPLEGALPAGAYVRTTVVGFKVISYSDTEIAAYLLSRTTTKAGETAKEDGAYSRMLMAAEWEDGDWKMSSAVTTRAAQAPEAQPKPQMGAPGDAAFNAAGWTAIREAS